MGSHRAESAPTTRRAAREAARAPQGSPVGRRARSVGRAGVLVALVAATVIVPVSEQALANGGGAVTQLLTDSTLPSTVSALTLLPGSGNVPASLQAAGKVVDQDASAVSRSQERVEVLPGCSGAAPTVLAANGQLPDSDLCTLWDGHTRVRADFAVALTEFDQAYVARFGADLCLSSGYRSLAEQRAVKAQKGYLAATPGKSNHGLGLAVDFCTDQLNGTRWTWMNQNGATFGIANPAWARSGGSGPYEKWHWEFTAAVAVDNSLTGLTSDSHGS